MYAAQCSNIELVAGPGKTMFSPTGNANAVPQSATGRTSTEFASKGPRLPCSSRMQSIPIELIVMFQSLPAAFSSPESAFWYRKYTINQELESTMQYLQLRRRDWIP
jgi:hypothetical protein